MIKTFLYFIGLFVVVLYESIMCTVDIVKLSKTLLLLRQGNQIDFL